MEKEMTKDAVSVVFKNNIGGSITFHLKEPQLINDHINFEIRKEFSDYSNGSFLVQPENDIIDTQRRLVHLDTSFITPV